jgi:hypothetical protein
MAGPDEEAARSAAQPRRVASDALIPPLDEAHWLFVFQADADNAEDNHDRSREDIAD